ncbi:MAG: hypothetical protein IIZ18_04565, partial [Ruminococcus sp.]|nr:hypothetical protein [Ruminococcus sp.]
MDGVIVTAAVILAVIALIEIVTLLCAKPFGKPVYIAVNPTVSSSSCACWRSIRSAAYPSSRSAGATRSQFPHSID